VIRHPFTEVHVNWKERLGQAYAYRELHGDYRLVPARLDELRRHAYRYGLTLDGPAFSLFYDDPAEADVASLRARVCLPVANDESLAGPWDYDVLPSARVVYAVVSGPVGQVPLSYPGLLAYMAERRWVVDGPIRESYLHAPETPEDGAPLTEVQVPWRPGP
jgi:effector-binding domain-containing protein